MKAFDHAIEIIARVLNDLPITLNIAKVIISNGSMLHRPAVRAGLSRWQEIGGELWFKLDRATHEGIRKINGIAISPRQIMENLAIAADLCPVRIQTCLFSFDGQPPAPHECQAYFDFLEMALQQGIPIEEVMLYGLARPSMQPEATRLGTVSTEWMRDFVQNLRSLGLAVRLTP